VTTTADTNSPVGSYTITAVQGTLSATNYAFAFVNGALSVTTTPLLITANSDSKTYDGNAYSTNNGATYTGFVNGETSAVLSGTLSYGGTSQGATNVGSYTIIPSGSTSANYAITYSNGTLVVFWSGNECCGLVKDAAQRRIKMQRFYEDAEILARILERVARPIVIGPGAANCWSLPAQFDDAMRMLYGALELRSIRVIDVTDGYYRHFETRDTLHFANNDAVRIG
jgi:hypothetical protein